MAKYVLGRHAQTRSDLLRHIGIIGGSLLLFSVLQVSFFARFPFFGATPDLIICTVLCISYFCGRYAGGITGLAGGFLIEAIGASGITLLPVIYFLFGYVVGYYSRAVIQKRYSSYLFYLGIALAIRATVTVLYAALTYRNLSLPTLLIHTLLPEAAGTAIAGAILYVPMRLLCRLLKRKRTGA